MSNDGHLATVIPIRKVFEDSVSDPFGDFKRAGLANARFGIDGGAPAFWGYYKSGERWNGWAQPHFLREVTCLIADWLNSAEAGSAWWVDDVLHVRGEEQVEEIGADHLGLYTFDGWAWLELHDSK